MSRDYDYLRLPAVCAKTGPRLDEIEGRLGLCQNVLIMVGPGEAKALAAERLARWMAGEPVPEIRGDGYRGGEVDARIIRFVESVQRQ